MKQVALRFNMLLEQAGIVLGDVRLLRHQTGKVPGKSPYTLWRDDLDAFERYQSTQDPAKRQRFAAPYWASFVVPPDGRTLFAGLYEVKRVGKVEPGTIDPLTGLGPGADKSPDKGPYDQYHCTLSPILSAYVGRIGITWGSSPSAYRAWVQRADKQDKEIVELASEFREEEFPGFTALVIELSEFGVIPPGWKAALKAARGVYLLACPSTREHYVGAAHGVDGFYGRWAQYAASGHGGNMALKGRNPTAYVVSVLEVAGSAASTADILTMEATWKRKLLSRSIGLNGN